LRAAAVGLVEGLNWEEILGGLRHRRPQLRLVTVRSSSGALILDDTYNAAPESTLAALNLLDELSEKRKIAVLGDMLELGPYEQQGHQMVGMRAAQIADILVTFGPLAHTYADAARRSGMKPNRIMEFDDSTAVIDWLKGNLMATDAALIKGSHGMRMDLIVAALEVQS
jgi:UDP-N-acetylmuramoyl-tripeptide--D-alanyl-D-alanine ligase